jgi:hypothetical protein
MTRLTKASRLNVTFLASGGVRISVTERCTRTDRQVLVQTPLLGARETGLARIVGK